MPSWAGVTKGALSSLPRPAALGARWWTRWSEGSFSTAGWVSCPPWRRRLLRSRAATLPTSELESPLNNLAQEMYSRRAVRRVVNATFEAWRTIRGQSEGSVRQDVDARKVAAFIVAAVETCAWPRTPGCATRLRSNLELLDGFLEESARRPSGGAAGGPRTRGTSRAAARPFAYYPSTTPADPA